MTINRFAFDRDTEVEIVRKEAIAAGAEDAVPINVHALGGDGGQEAAEVVKAAADKGGDFKFLYPLDASIKEKIETIATKIYGADGVDYLPEAEAKIKQFTEQGLDKPAAVHGQDAPLAVARPDAQGPPARLPRADPRHPSGDRRRLPLPAARRDAHHARPAPSGRRPSTSTSTSTPAASSACSRAGERTSRRAARPPSSRRRRRAAGRRLSAAAVTDVRRRYTVSDGATIYAI